MILNENTRSTLKIITLMFLSIALLLIGVILTEGGKIGEVVATLSLEGLGIFTIITIFVAMLVTQSAIDYAKFELFKTKKIVKKIITRTDEFGNEVKEQDIEYQESEYKIQTNKLQNELNNTYNNCDKKLLNENLAIYNQENIKNELNAKRASLIAELETKQYGYEKDSKKYNEYKKRVEKAKTKSFKVNYKPIQPILLSVKRTHKNSYVEDANYYKSTVEFDLHYKGLIKSIITKIIITLILSLGGSILIGNNDWVTIAIIMLIQVAFMTTSFISAVNNATDYLKTTTLDILESKLKLLKKLTT